MEPIVLVKPFRPAFLALVKSLTRLFILAGLVLLPLAGGFQPARSAASPELAAMPQLRSAGHVLGFRPGQVILAGMDHALTVALVGAKTATPLAQGGSQVDYPNAWPGISLRYETDGQSIAKSTYRIAPGADPARIRLHYNLAPQLQPDGSLRFAFESGELTETAPLAWQDIAGQRRPVEVAFEVRGAQVSFHLGRYNSAYPLVIDPYYAWHTFAGSSMNDGAQAVAVDPSGNIYLAGFSSYSWNGPAGQAPKHAHSERGDLVLMKFSSAGQYAWHTFYGSSTSSTSALCLIVPNSTEIYLAGISTGNWDGPSGETPKHAHTGDNKDDILLMKLDIDGNYLWHGFYGGSDDDIPTGVAVSGTEVYLSGYSKYSWDMPGPVPPLHASSGGSFEMVVLKIDSSGVYQWHTFYGSASADLAFSIAVSGTAVYVVGDSQASWSGPAGGPLHAYAGLTDMVVLKLNSSGAHQWHTFYGTAGYDGGYDVAVYGGNQIYLTGYSDTAWNGPGGQTPLHNHSNLEDDAYVLKLNDAGAYQWHTFYGAAAEQWGSELSLDPSGNLYVAIDSKGSWLGPGDAAPLRPFESARDAGVLKLTAAGAYTWHTFYPLKSETGSGMTMDLVSTSSFVYLGAVATVNFLGDSGQASLHPYSSSSDLFLLGLYTSGSYYFHTYYGATTISQAYGLAQGGSGEVYVVGNASLPQAPPNTCPNRYFWDDYQPNNPADTNAVVARIEANGDCAWYLSFGGTGSDTAYAAYYRPDTGALYVTGVSADGWEPTNGANPLHYYTGGKEIFALRLDNAAAYQWHTFYGSATDDTAYGIDVHPNGTQDYVYIVGESNATWKGPSNQLPANPYVAGNDMVVLRLWQDGSYWGHTFLGSDANDTAYAIDYLSSEIYLTGQSSAGWNGPGPTAPIKAYTGGADLTVANLDYSLSYHWHTFYGSASADYGQAIRCVSSTCYVAGFSGADWLGPAGQSPMHAHSTSGYDLAVLSLFTSGAYNWHTFYGTTGHDQAFGLALDGSYLYIAGRSTASWNGPSGQLPLNPYTADSDLTLLRLYLAGGYADHAFYGGSGYDEARALVTDGLGNLVLAGRSQMAWNGEGSQPPHDPHTGDTDLLVLRLVANRLYLPVLRR